MVRVRPYPLGCAIQRDMKILLKKVRTKTDQHATATGWPRSRAAVMAVAIPFFVIVYR